MSAVLGRAYGLHILDAMSHSDESAFSDMLQELGISPTTLSSTLRELVDEGFAERRAYGRRTYYSITEKGSDFLRKQKGGAQFDIDRITQLVAKRLREDGTKDKYARIPNEEFVDAVRKRVRCFISEIGEELAEGLEDEP